MIGVFYCFKEELNISKLRAMKVTDVFIYCKREQAGLNKTVKELSEAGFIVHWTIDCFSSGLTEERMQEIFTEIESLNGYFSGVCLDAVRFWQGSFKNWFKCSEVTQAVMCIKSATDLMGLELSACVKAEFNNPLLRRLGAMYYGQDYQALKQLCKLLPMAYSNEYLRTGWALINRSYNPAEIASSINGVAILGAYEHQTWELLGKEMKDCKDYVLFAYDFLNQVKT